jgi:hypothetical protein
MMAESNEPQMLVLGNRRGRPRVETPKSVPVSFRMETPHYDRLVKMALTQDKAVAALVRELMLTQLK